MNKRIVAIVDETGEGLALAQRLEAVGYAIKAFKRGDFTKIIEKAERDYADGKAIHTLY